MTLEKPLKMNLKFLEEKWFLILCYILANCFFLFQHLKGISWDFMVYSMNGQYFFGNKFFFEWLRPPLIPLLIGFFGFLGFKFAEFLYIAFVSFIHFLSSIFFAKKFGIHKNYFYILSLSFFVLINGLNVGSELLVLSLIQFFLVFLNTNFSGFFLGLAFLTRYNSFIFLPLIFFNKKIKKILLGFFAFFITILPWFYYNYDKTGNYLYSFVDSYALNVAFRDYYVMAFNFNHLLVVMNFLIPFFVLGLVKILKKYEKKDIMLFLVFVLSLASYASVPFKTPRYLFFLVLPTVYFSCIFFEKFRFKRVLLLILILINILFLFSSNYLYEVDNLDSYKDPVNYTMNCSVMSNAWVHLNYLGREAEPFPHEEMVEHYLNKGKIIVLYKYISEPQYAYDPNFLNSYPIIKENENYIILGNLERCLAKKNFVDHYLERYKERVELVYNKTEDVSNCSVLFEGTLKDLCKSAKLI